MNLEHEIKEAVAGGGADFFGIADLSLAHAAILAQGGPVVAAFPRAISIGIGLLHAIVDQLPQRTERAGASGYRHHIYGVVNRHLDLLSLRVSRLLQQLGYRALPIAASNRLDQDRLCDVFSHKLAAHLAGLGWIGKSCLLVTPQVGPRVRWATILTDAPLMATGRPMEDNCRSCRECVEKCPVRAFTGEPFRAHEGREKRFEASKCDHYVAAMRKKDPETAVCGLCVYVCPYGTRHTATPGERS